MRVSSVTKIGSLASLRPGPRRRPRSPASSPRRRPPAGGRSPDGGRADRARRATSCGSKVLPAGVRTRDRMPRLT